MKKDNGRNEKKFKLAVPFVVCFTIILILSVLTTIVLAACYAAAFNVMSLAGKIAMPIAMLIMLLMIWLSIAFLRWHCMVSDDSFTYKMSNRYFYSALNSNPMYAKYIKSKEETIRNGETIEFEDVLGVRFYQVIAYRFGVKYIVFVMNNGKRKYAIMNSFTNHRIQAIIDEIIKRSNGAIEDMRRDDDIIDLLKNPNILIK